MRLGAEHIAQIGGAILIGRGSDRNELEESVLDALDGIGRELDTAGSGQPVRRAAQINRRLT